MPDVHSLAGFALVALVMVMTPGPNMAYLVSRTLTQGRLAGFLSLAGVGAGFLVYLLAAAFGLTGLLLAVPHAYDAIRLAGAAYLGYLAYQALKPGGHSAFEVRDLPARSRWRLVGMGFLTNLLNPKIAVMYLSLLPQFIDPVRGALLGQSLALGLTQITIAMTGNALIVLAAARVAAFLTHRPIWARVQRWVMGTVLAGLAVRLLAQSRA